MLVFSEIGTTAQFSATLFRKAPFELQLLAACCTWPPEQYEDRISSLINSKKVDWQLLLGLAERHRVSGLLANSLRRQIAAPEDIGHILARRAARIERDNLLQLAIAVKVSRLFEREKIPFVIMKGAPLAHQLYGNVSVRHSKDIDLLIDQDQISAAHALLFGNGFKATSGLGADLTPRQAQSWERNRKNHDYTHIPTGTQIELHWRSFDNSHLASVTTDRVHWVECAPGMHLPSLLKEDLFPMLCAHGAGHAWFRLKWLIDVATLLARSSVEDQKELMNSARRRGLARPAEQAVLLSLGLFGDQRILPLNTSTAIGRWLARIGRDALLQVIPEAAPSAEFVPRKLGISKLLLRPSWVYKLEQLRVYSASPADWKILRLPDWLHFTYPILRIPLWLRRRWNRRRRT